MKSRTPLRPNGQTLSDGCRVDSVNCLVASARSIAATAGEFQVNSYTLSDQMSPQLVIEALSTILLSGQVTELRALGAQTTYDQGPHTSSGYFDNPDALVASLQDISHAKGIYVIPNPVKPDLLARSHNRIQRAEKGHLTSDGDIECRQWLLCDIDPVRSSKISSTEDEHAASICRG